MTRSSEKVNDNEFEENGLWRGEGVVGEEYPLKAKTLHMLSDGFIAKDRGFVAAYDGQSLRFVDYDSSSTPHTISIYEFSVDANLSDFKTMSYREYEGENLKDAKPTANKVMCNNLMS
jgi:hypothetical protein